jgi:hypothetical protein
MRIRIDINEVSAMADTLIAAAESIAEVGADVGVSDLPAEVAAIFQHNSATMRANFDNLATAYKREALALKLRALLAHFDVGKAVAIYPPAPPPAVIVAGQPVVASVAGRSNYNPSKYYMPGSAAYNRLTPEQKRMNNMMAQMIVMPSVMSNYNKSMERYQASLGLMFEPSYTQLWDQLGKRPLASEVKFYAPNHYKLSQP